MTPTDLDRRVGVKDKVLFVEAMQRQGKDLSQARTTRCAQCPVEYCFNPQDKSVVFPWDNGMKPDQMYAYCEQKTNGFERGFVHPDSKGKITKAQYPDFGTWSMSIHAENGVICVDCHMPYMRENGQKYTSHWMTSPLKTPLESCGKCHGTNTKLLIARVKTMQDHTFQLQFTAWETVAKARAAIDAPAPVVLGLHVGRKRHGLPQCRSGHEHTGAGDRFGAAGNGGGKPGGQKQRVRQ